jgi:hypothetical protein
MNAARQLVSELPMPRLVPPRPTPKSVPPPPMQEVIAPEVSDTCIHEVAEMAKSSPELARALSKPPPPLPRAARPSSRALVLPRTFAFFVTDLIIDGIRAARATLTARWHRAAQRARA